MKHILAILALVAFTQQAQAQTRMEQAQTSIEKSPSFRTVPVIPWNYIPNAVPSDVLSQSITALGGGPAALQQLQTVAGTSSDPTAGSRSWILVWRSCKVLQR